MSDRTGEGGMGAASIDAQMVAMLTKDYRALKAAGDDLAVAALRVATEYDGVHRLRLAVARWSTTLADEGGRGERHRVAPGTAAPAGGSTRSGETEGKGPMPVRAGAQEITEDRGEKGGGRRERS